MSKIIEVISKDRVFEVLVDSDFSHKGKVSLKYESTSKNGKSFYYFHVWVDGKGVRLHRYIMGVTDPNIHVDHINGNTLDNRKENLRLATHEQNMGNQKAKGCIYDKRKKKWRAYIWANKKQNTIGFYSTEKEAREAYKKAHVEKHREFSPYYKELV